MIKLSFDHLSDTEFEEFCYDLLSAMGFINMSWRKGTGFPSSPSDRGRDIECQCTVKDIDETEYIETWFVECKHYKNGVPPDKIQGALAWASSERPDKLLIIASNFLSNPTKDFLESYNKNHKPSFRVKVWEYPDLEKLSRGKVELLRKYELIDLAPISDYGIAESIFLSRIEAFANMLFKVAVKMGIEDVKKDPLSLAEMWLKFARKAEHNAGRYTPAVQQIALAGIIYTHEDNPEKEYTCEKLTELSESIINVMLFVDGYAQTNNIQY